MKSRIDLINHLCTHYPWATYLEIGCRHDECFRNVKAWQKVGVDPQWGGTRRMTSDQFFVCNDVRFDVVFVDGLHFSEQVHRDVNNALACLTPDGVIVMHDCLPDDDFHQDPGRARPLFASGAYDPDVGEWTGDVWRVVVELCNRPDVDIVLWPEDHGCGVVTVRPSEPTPMICPRFEDYQAQVAEHVAIVADEKELDRWLGIS